MTALETSSDLVFGVFLLVAASGLTFCCSRAAARRVCSWVSGVFAASVFLVVLAFAIRCHGQLNLARYVPLSNAIVVGNWLPLGAAVLGGVVASRSTIPAWRRTAVAGMLCGLAWYTVGYDLFAPAPRPGDPWFESGVCMQTTADSCSACCAAALLIECGIPASEREMIDLCLTRRGGTPELGLYRGLKLKTRNTSWRVEVMSCTPDELIEQAAFPCLLLVDGSAGPGTDQPRWWQPRRASHAVIAYGITDSDKLDIRNPSAGQTQWTIDFFRRCWFGHGLRLVRRD